MNYLILCFNILILCAFVASLPQPNEKHHVNKTTVSEKDETQQVDRKKVIYHNDGDDGVYKNQNSYPRQYGIRENHRRPVHQHHQRGIQGVNSRWPAAYHGYNAYPAHRPIIVPQAYYRDERVYQGSGDGIEPIDSGDLKRELRDDPIPLIYSDSHYPHENHPYHGHPPLPLYRPHVDEYQAYPSHPSHVPHQSVLPIYLFSAPGGSQIRNYFQRILQKVPGRVNIKKKPKIIIEYVNGTVEYVDIPDLIEYAPGVVLSEQSKKNLKANNDDVDNVPNLDEGSVVDSSDSTKQNYVKLKPSLNTDKLIISLNKHRRIPPFTKRDENNDSYYNNESSSESEIESGQPPVVLVLGDSARSDYSYSEGNPDPESAYNIKQRNNVGHQASTQKNQFNTVRAQHDPTVVDKTDNNENTKEPLNSSYENVNFQDSEGASKVISTVRDIEYDDNNQRDYIPISENGPDYSYYNIKRKQYVGRRNPPHRDQFVSYPYRYYNRPLYVRRPGEKAEITVNDSNNSQVYLDSTANSGQPVKASPIEEYTYQDDKQTPIFSPKETSNSGITQEHYVVRKIPSEKLVQSQNRHNDNPENYDEAKNNEESDDNKNNSDSLRTFKEIPIADDTDPDNNQYSENKDAREANNYEEQKYYVTSIPSEEDISDKADKNYIHKPQEDSDQKNYSSQSDIDSTETTIDALPVEETNKGTITSEDDHSDPENIEFKKTPIGNLPVEDIKQGGSTSTDDNLNLEYKSEHSEYDIDSKEITTGNSPVEDTRQGGSTVKDDSFNPEYKSERSEYDIDSKDVTTGNSPVEDTRQGGSTVIDDTLNPEYKSDRSHYNEEQDLDPKLSDKSQYDQNPTKADDENGNTETLIDEHAYNNNPSDSSLQNKETSRVIATEKDADPDTTRNNDPLDSEINSDNLDDTKNNNRQEHQHPSEKPYDVDDYLNDANHPNSNEDEKYTTTVISTVNTQPDDNVREHNESNLESYSDIDEKQKPLSDEGQIVAKEIDSDSPANEKYEDEETKQPSNYSYNDDIKLASDTDSSEPSNTSQDNIADDENLEKSTEAELYFIKKATDTPAYNKSEEEDNIVERIRESYEDESFPDSVRDTKEATAVTSTPKDESAIPNEPKDVSSTSNNEPTVTHTNSNYNENLKSTETSDKIRNELNNAEEPVHDSYDNSNYSDSEVETKEPTPVSSSVTTVNESHSYLDEITSEEDNYPKKDDDLKDLNEKYSIKTDSAHIEDEPATSQSDDSNPSVQSSETEKVSEEYPEKIPNDSDKRFSDSNKDTEVESTISEPPSTSTHDDNGNDSASTEISIKSDKNDSNLDSKEVNPTIEEHHETNEGDVHTDTSKVDNINTDVAQDESTESTQSVKHDINTITTSDASDDDQGSIEDQDENGHVQNDISDDQNDHTSDGEISRYDSAEDVHNEDNVPFQDESNEIEKNNHDNTEIEENESEHDELTSGSVFTDVPSTVDHNTETTTSTSTINDKPIVATRDGTKTTTKYCNDNSDGIENDKKDKDDSNLEHSSDKSSSTEIFCTRREKTDSKEEVAPLVAFHPDTLFYKKLMEEYNKLYFVKMDSSASVIHRDTKSLVYENGTVVDYLSETYWEKENDDEPIKIRTSQVIRQPKKKDDKDC